MESAAAFPLFAAIGIVMVAFASFLVTMILVFAATHSTVLAVIAGQLIFGAIAVGALIRKKLRPVALGLARAGGVFAGTAVLLGSSLWYLNLRIVDLIPMPDGGVQQLQDIVEGPSLPVVLFALGLLPAVCEELLFRGLFLRALAVRFTPVVAVAIAALVFAVYHLSLTQLIPTFSLGLITGALTLRARSVIPAMIVHLLNNSIAIVVARGDVPGVATWIEDHASVALGVAMALTASGLAILAKARR